MANKVKGEVVFLSIWTGAWTQVGGQKDITLDRGAGNMEVTNKNSDGWEEFLVGFKNWSCSFDAFLIENAVDPGFLQFESAFESRTITNFRISTENQTYTGLAIIEGLSMNGPIKDATSISFTLKGTAALVKA